MSQKHYNAAYLEDTGAFLKGLKEYSYKPFAEVKDGTVIDLGCGTGLDVIGLSAMLGNDVQVVGVDHDDALLDKGRAAANGQNVTFVCSEATQIPFETDGTNGIRAERLVQHLKDPQGVVDEMRRVLKAGQPAVFVETDWASLVFYQGDVSVQEKLLHYLTKVKINNGFAARKLTGYLVHSEFRNIKTEVFPFTLRSLKEANDYLWIELILKEMLEKGHLAEKEHALFVDTLKKADENAYFACSINILVVSSIK
ncbi:MAG: methyltransferase domain-containing protein [Chitinophagaceae bacterium]